MITAPDQAWLDRLTRFGVAAFVVEGECGCSCHKLAPAQGVHCRCLDLPPDEFVAMTGPCEKCVGIDYAPGYRCRTCHGDGRKRVGVVERCDCDNGTTWTYFSTGPWEARPCPDCTNGTVDTGLVVTVEVVPIEWDQPPGGDHNYVTPDGFYLGPTARGHRGPFWNPDDPSIAIGKFAVVCTLDREAE